MNPMPAHHRPESRLQEGGIPERKESRVKVRKGYGLSRGESVKPKILRVGRGI